MLDCYSYLQKWWRDLLSNYHPISLLIVVIYTQDPYITSWHLNWEGYSLLDHVFTSLTFSWEIFLWNLFHPLCRLHWFQIAFNCISIFILWEKWNSSLMDRKLLVLIYKLCENSWMKVQNTLRGHCPKEIQDKREVRQGCFLALLSSSVHQPLIDKLKNPSLHPSKLGNRRTSVLLYAGDAIGLKLAL